MENWLQHKIFNSKKVISATTLKDKNFYNNFSLATHTGDNIKEIIKNREYFMKHFVPRMKAVTLNQTHSDIIVNIDEINLLSGWTQLPIEADGMVTTKKNISLNILTADCLAIVFSDEESGIIGAIHSGWRGTQQKIAVKLIEKMLSLGAKVENIKCAIAPGICGKCYEVGNDVADNFKEYPQTLTKKDNGKWLFDNTKAVSIQLEKVGILSRNIKKYDFCTYCDNEKFFSYRKGDKKGRFVTFIAMI